MDETDTPPTAGPEAQAAETARQWAEQQRAQARAQFVTPSWIGPSRTSQAAAHIPAQAEPDHDEIEFVLPTVSSNPIPDTAHWAEKARPRMVAGTILLLALAGVLTSLVLAIVTQSFGAIIALVACAFVAVIFRGALMGSGVTTVDLKGSIMRIRKGGVLDIINLADPMHIVELVGTPDRPDWRLHIEALDGRNVEIGPSEVDAAEVHRIVEYYRAIAGREKRERDHRFNL
jgi:hypothetical protein